MADDKLVANELHGGDCHDRYAILLLMLVLVVLGLVLLAVRSILGGLVFGGVMDRVVADMGWKMIMVDVGAI